MLPLTLKMTTAQVAETSVTVNNNRSIQDFVHPYEMTPGNLSQTFHIIWLLKITLILFRYRSRVNSFVIMCKGHSWSRLKMYVGGLAYETSRLHEIPKNSQCLYRFLCFIFSYYQHIQFLFKNRVRHWSS